MLDILRVLPYIKTVAQNAIYKDIGALIKERRKTLGWKQENLANAMRISRGSLANIETGKQGILIHQLYNFAAALRLRVVDLLPTDPVAKNAGERAQLPIPGNLPPEQKRQLADLILQVDTSAPTNREKSHAKNPRR